MKKSHIKSLIKHQKYKFITFLSSLSFYLSLIMKQHHYILACVLPFLLPYSVLGDKTTQQYLSEGNEYLTTGEFNNALTSFDAAIRKL